MQTFLPYSDFNLTTKCLDYKRLGKQRVEAYQIAACLLGWKTKSGKSYSGWKNHPACKMWKGYELALLHYMNVCIQEWVARGYKNNMEIADWIYLKEIIMPPWLGDERMHSSHRSNLLRKNFEFYSKFGWKEEIDIPYVWGKVYEI